MCCVAHTIAGAVWPADSEEADSLQAQPNPSLATFMQCWCCIVNSLLRSATSTGSMTDTDAAHLPDLWDGRMWHFMMKCISLAQPTGLSPQALQSAQLLMHAIGQAAGTSQSSVDEVIASTPSAREPHGNLSCAAATQRHDKPAASAPADKADAEYHIQGNALVDAFLGQQQQQSPESDDEQSEAVPRAAEELRVFHDTYHWHSGLPIEPSYIGETSTDNLLKQYQNASVYQMACCTHLSRYQRAKLQRTIDQQQDVKLRHSDRAERSKILSRAAETGRAWLRSNFERMDQLNARFVTKYGETMSATKYCMPDPSSSKKAKKSTSKQSIIDANKAASKAKSEAERAAQWAKVQKELQQYAKVHNDCWDFHIESRVTTFLHEGKEKATSPDTFLAACCFMLQGEIEAWKKQCRNRSSNQRNSSNNASSDLGTAASAANSARASGHAGTSDMSHAVAAWMTVQHMLASDHFQNPAAATASKAATEAATEAAAATQRAVKQALKDCKQAMQLLGFAEAASSISALLDNVRAVKPSKSKSRPASAPASTTESRKPSSPTCKPVPASSTDRFKVGLSEADFQLRFCGDQLQRGGLSVPDPRVSSFTPDAWQRGVLDGIDARESCVICAPTSSGKTFISSFCMDRVLRSTKDGIVVFVAPTKALVNQTAAQARPHE